MASPTLPPSNNTNELWSLGLGPREGSFCHLLSRFCLVIPSLLSLFISCHLSLSPVSAVRSASHCLLIIPPARLQLMLPKAANNPYAVPILRIFSPLPHTFLSLQWTPYIKVCCTPVPVVFITSEHPCLLLFGMYDFTFCLILSYISKTFFLFVRSILKL